MRGAEEVTRDERVAAGRAQKAESNALKLMQINCRSIRHKSSDFWNLIDRNQFDVIICTVMA
jgi:hypothetical protein